MNKNKKIKKRVPRATISNDTPEKNSVYKNYPKEKPKTYIEPSGFEKPTKKKPTIFKRILKFILIISVILILSYIGYNYMQNKQNSNKPLEKLVAEQIDTNKSNLKEENNENIDDDLFVSELTKEGKKLVTKEENWDKNRVERDGEHRTKLSDAKIGQIDINKVRIHEPIYAGASELNLRRGSATVDYKEPLNEQTTAIAGHVAGRYQYFTEIKQLVKGDLIKIKDYKNKKTYTYKVDRTYTVKPTQREILADNKKRKARKLLLMTCHNYDGTKRIFKERWIVEAYEI